MSKDQQILKGAETIALLAKEGKYLTFKLEDEIYGIEILKVQEIICIMEVTSIPKTPDYIRGVINLRGRVIPVIDLRLKFGMPEKENTDKTCIIVVQVKTEKATITMGAVVDSVSEVLEISSEQIEAPPAFGNNVDLRFIMGMGKIAEKVIMLLDVDKVFSNSDINQISKVI